MPKKGKHVFLGPIQSFWFGWTGEQLKQWNFGKALWGDSSTYTSDRKP